MKKRIQRFLVCLLLLVLATGIGFGIYVSDYYRAGPTAAAMASDPALVATEGSWLALGTEEKSVGLIFYPGANVEHTAYLPILGKLQENGVNCYLVEMPLRLAFFGENLAQDVMDAHPEIETWYLAGHSLGGAYGSHFAAKHPEEVQGVILLGAYLFGDFPVSKSLTIYGSEDRVLHRMMITYSENIHILEGGNHSQCGDYGFQNGDGVASISQEDQWEQTAELILEFVAEGRYAN